MTKRGFEVAKGFENKGINLPKRGTTNAAGYDFEAAEDVKILPLQDIQKLHKEKVFKIMTKDFFGVELTEDELKTGEAFDKIDPVSFLSVQAKILDLAKVLEVSIEDILEDPNAFDFSDIVMNSSEEQNDQILGAILSDESVAKIKELKKMFKPVLVPTGVKAYMGDEEVLILANRSSNPLKRSLILANGIGVIDADYYGNEDNDGHIMGQFINFGSEAVFIKKGERIFQGMFQPFLIADNDVAGGKRVGGHGSTDSI